LHREKYIDYDERSNNPFSNDNSLTINHHQFNSNLKNKFAFNMNYKSPNKFYYNNHSYTIIDDLDDSSSKKNSSENNIDEGKTPGKAKNRVNKDKHKKENPCFPNCNSNRISKATNIQKSNNSSINKKNIITDNFEIFYGFEINKITLCSSCLRWKLPRTHHCRSCGKCVLKMDHHCPWLANCIGFNNYKFFCLMIIYGFFLSVMVFFTFWETVLNFLYSAETSVCSTTVVCLCYSLNFGLLIFLSYLFNYNISLILNNETIIERADRERFMEGVNINSNYPSITNHVSYDKGCYRNFVEVFGSNPILWFLPIANKEEYIKSFIN